MIGPSVRSIVVVPEPARQAETQVSQEWQEVLGRRGRRPSCMPPLDAGINATHQAAPTLSRPLKRSSGPLLSLLQPRAQRS
jgi:hypothetical protein